MTNREIDALVAEKVMGWMPFPLADGEVMEGYYYNGITTWPTPAPNYSTNIADAWQVVEMLSDEYEYDHVTISSSNKVWYCDIVKNLPANEDGELDSDVWDHTASTAPMAICLAALKAMGVEIE